MQTDLHSFKRRPFFVPLLMPLALLGLMVAAAVWLLDARTSTVMILVRSAEQGQGAANPPLNAEGQKRAAGLQQFLALAKPERGVDAVYVAEGAAAQQTATPVAESMGLAVNVVAAADWAGLPGFIMSNHAGETVLIVGSREGALALLRDNTSTEYSLDENDFSSVFVISKSRLSKAAVVRLRY